MLKETVNVPPSRIIEVGNLVKKLTQETGKEYLALNRGVNAVVPIDLDKLVKEMNLNDGLLQNYPVSHGAEFFKKAVIEEYFDSRTTSDMITVTSGAISALDLIFRVNSPTTIYLPELFWGPYKYLAELNGHAIEHYKCLDREFPDDSLLIICDPNNPTGSKYDDEYLFDSLMRITSKGTLVVFDSPYRRMRRDRTDLFFQRISDFKNLVIVESFSKSLGIPGLRIAFVRTLDRELTKAIRTRLTYGFSGVNMFAQMVVANLLTTTNGREIVKEFKDNTNTEIIKNIDWLEKHDMLENSLYSQAPDGIFAVINKSEEYLLSNRIGSVTLDFFTAISELKERYSNSSRICISVPHKKFVEFFSKL